MATSACYCASSYPGWPGCGKVYCVSCGHVMSKAHVQTPSSTSHIAPAHGLFRGLCEKWQSHSSPHVVDFGGGGWGKWITHHGAQYPGRLRSTSPVLAITSDQASPMFAAANYLAHHCGIRVVWYPDVNHIEHNVERGVLTAAGLSQINEKTSFLSRLPYGPSRDAGHWFNQMKFAFQARSSV